MTTREREQLARLLKKQQAERREEAAFRKKIAEHFDMPYEEIERAVKIRKSKLANASPDARASRQGSRDMP